jgi:endonuclease/exonuclease/phosphatase family metal-dependent hydrolase
MGKLAVYKYISLMFLVFQCVVSVFTIVALFGGEVNPVGHSARTMLVYVLPILIAINLVMLIYWLVRRKWIYALIPVITVACCIPYMGTLIQLGSVDKNAKAEKELQIATYNVAMFGRETSGFLAQDILAQMRRHKVDVLCLQEYNEISGDKKNSESYKEYLPYMAIGRNDMVIFSRYPIKGNKTILFDDTNNSAMWADIDVKGQMIRVFNVHLQTTGINTTLHRASKLQAANPYGDYGKSNSRVLNAIFGNYMLGVMFRAGQAITVANEKRSSELPCILCGDFNDVPYSYVYNTMLGDMVDGFKECGSGWMYTFRGRKAVRIDYIFHDPFFKGLSYYKEDLTTSDHLPVFMKVTY